MLRVICLHISSANRKRFEEALADAPEHTLHFWVSSGSQYSAGYDEYTGLAAKCPTFESFLRRHVPEWRPGDQVVLVTFSAGTWAWRAWSREASNRALVNGVLLLDGLHAGRDEQDPAEELFAGVLKFGREALADPTKFLWITNSEIKPPYASTTAVAEEFLDLLGVPRTDPRRPRPDHAELDGVTVADFWVSATGVTASDHSSHVTILAPELLRTEVTAFAHTLVDYSLGDTEPAPPPSLTLGERCVQWCREEMARENPPSANTLAGWFSHTTRLIEGREVPLGIRSGNHCAVAQCEAARATAFPGELVPHHYRAAAKELMRDAVRANAWHPIEEVRDGKWTPTTGDLAVYHRPGGAPWWGHVERVSGHVPEGFKTIGANEQGRKWVEEIASYMHQHLLGFIAYPRPQLQPGSITDADRYHVAQLIYLTIDDAESEYWEHEHEH